MKNRRLVDERGFLVDESERNPSTRVIQAISRGRGNDEPRAKKR